MGNRTSSYHAAEKRLCEEAYTRLVETEIPALVADYGQDAVQSAIGHLVNAGKKRHSENNIDALIAIGEYRKAHPLPCHHRVSESAPAQCSAPLFDIAATGGAPGFRHWGGESASDPAATCARIGRPTPPPLPPPPPQPQPAPAVKPIVPLFPQMDESKNWSTCGTIRIPPGYPSAAAIVVDYKDHENGLRLRIWRIVWRNQPDTYRWQIEEFKPWHDGLYNLPCHGKGQSGRFLTCWHDGFDTLAELVKGVRA